MAKPANEKQVSTNIRPDVKTNQHLSGITDEQAEANRKKLAQDANAFYEEWIKPSDAELAYYQAGFAGFVAKPVVKLGGKVLEAGSKIISKIDETAKAGKKI